jgi:hypothetical protein
LAKAWPRQHIGEIMNKCYRLRLKLANFNQGRKSRSGVFGIRLAESAYAMCMETPPPGANCAHM